VAPGAVFPLVRTQAETRVAEQLYGKVAWLGAWGNPSANFAHAPGTQSVPGKIHGPWEVPPLKEGAPQTKPLNEDAAHFLVRQVREHPGQVTIYAAGPLTDIALAISIDPGFAEATKGIVMMGGSLNPQTDDPEFANSPRHEFNFWFDPEAAHIVLRAHWPRIDVTTVDVSIKAMFTSEMFGAIAKSSSPAARYIAKYAVDRYYMWDELAACAWIEPSLITKAKDLYMDVDLSHGPGYGHTLTWSGKEKPATDVRMVHAQLDLNFPKFARMFVDLMSAPPGRH
jgi:inosine-uridine nucleoside N-ribohydrolase